MAGYGGIGGLSQARDLFAAPGSLMGYDPYYQDIQRFQQGGLGTTDPVSYASLQDPDPYGAERTAAARGRSIMGIDPVDVATTVAGTLAGAPLGAVGAITGGIGAYQNLSEADKMRAGALPVGTTQPLGFWDTLATMWPEFLGGRSYEEALTDEDLETLSAYGLGGDLGVEAGGYNIADPKGTWADAPSGGPRVDTPLGIAQSNWAQMRAKELAQAAKYGESWTDPNPPPAWLGRPRSPDPVTVETLPPPDPVTVEVLPPPPVVYVSQAEDDWGWGGGGGESYGFGAGGDEGLGY